ncbi:uncharacterized protein IUM83_11220 [Phytophthora cinnamomi]|uniref:uncharacterized protein n=1 Tax=Phytophthora cinnamomi TaxID=4785 RepID=UPI0035596D85|nr:hypothetical protein IUM83_11220 [Phytophthora cinnamomi]
MIPPVKLEHAAAVAIAPTPTAAQCPGGDNQAADAALEIALQPPETWYKDQFGRKATFELRVRRSGPRCAQCAAQRLLAVQLLYESGRVVEKQEILHVLGGQCLDQNGESALAIRIAEVSKNHLNQRFRVEVAVPRCPGSCGYKTSVVSEPVLVLSKRKKRAVKHTAETDSPAKAKKAKRSSVQGTPNRKLSSDSPDSSQSSSTVTGNVTAAIAEMEDLMPPRSSGAMAPFTPETPNLCLWANAAFDLLYKLQWQRVPTNTADKPGANLDEILRQALSKAYKCPSCQETYGQVPAHRDDCDLKLLLDQGGQPDPGAAGAGNDFAGNHLPQWSSDKQFEWSDRPQAMYSGGDITPKIQASPYNLSQDLLRISGREGGESQVLAIGFENTNISSWKDYASISKLLYSTSYLDGKSPQAGTALSPTLQWTGPLIDMSLEGGVQFVLASDFQGCGFPALDASMALVGFYNLLTETSDSPAELRFTPNMFPLPEEMLRELEGTITEWMKTPNICCRRESILDKPEDSLARLKNVVLHQTVRNG